METLIKRVQLLALKDLQRGVKPDRLRKDIDKYASQEKYEFCAGIKRALEAAEL